MKLSRITHGQKSYAETGGQSQHVLRHEDLRPADVHLVHFKETKERLALGEIVEQPASRELDLDAFPNTVRDRKHVEPVSATDRHLALNIVARLMESLLHEVCELTLVAEHSLGIIAASGGDHQRLKHVDVP